MVEKHLNDLNIKELEFIILTHFHNDHYGNIINIISNYNVKRLYLKEANEDVKILVTDHQKYIFTISDVITYDTIIDESLFLLLNKD